MESNSTCITDLHQLYRLNTASAFEKYSDMVYRLAYVRTADKSDAEDILSDVFLRLVKNETKIKSEEHLKAWLIRTTLNRSNSLLGAAYRKHRVAFDEVTFGSVDKRENESVLFFVLALPVKYKTVVYMYYYEGYSVEEIASLCSIAAGTVKSRLARARNILKNQLKGEMLDV